MPSENTVSIVGAVCDRHAKNLGMASAFDRSRMPELPPAQPEHVATSFPRSYHLPRFVKGGTCHDPRYEFGYIYDGACDHQSDRDRFGHSGHVRDSWFQPDAGLDRDLPAVHDFDQRHRLSDSASNVLEVA